MGENKTKRLIKKYFWSCKVCTVSIDYYPYNKIINHIKSFSDIYCHKGTYIVCNTNIVPCVPVIIQCGWWIEQHMALTDVAVSIRCARLLICYQSDKVMCGDTLSLTVDQINRLSLPLRLSVPHPSPPHTHTPHHLTQQHIFSHFLLLFFSCFNWMCLAKKYRVIIFAIFATTYSIPRYLWRYHFTYLQRINFFKL